MDENLYQSTREGIIARHRERIGQADSDRDEELNALERLRPYWESLTLATNGNSKSASEDKSFLKKTETESASMEIKAVGHQSDFPPLVRIVVEQDFSLTDDITQSLVYKKLTHRFPEQLKGIDEGNIRSRISKSLMRMRKHGILELLGKSTELGRALIYRKLVKMGAGQLNFGESTESEE